jgi:hypothetical protein
VIESDDFKAISGYLGQFGVKVARVVEGVSKCNVKIGQGMIKTQQLFDTLGGSVLFDLIHGWSGAQFSEKERQAILEIAGGLDPTHPESLKTAIRALAESAERANRAARGALVAPIDPTFLLTQGQAQTADGVAKSAIDAFQAKKITEVELRNKLGTASVLMGAMADKNRQDLNKIASLEFQKAQIGDSDPTKTRMIDIAISKFSKEIRELRAKQRGAMDTEIGDNQSTQSGLGL